MPAKVGVVIGGGTMGTGIAAMFVAGSQASSIGSPRLPSRSAATGRLAQ